MREDHTRIDEMKARLNSPMFDSAEEYLLCFDEAASQGFDDRPRLRSAAKQIRQRFPDDPRIGIATACAVADSLLAQHPVQQAKLVAYLRHKAKFEAMLRQFTDVEQVRWGVAMHWVLSGIFLALRDWPNASDSLKKVAAMAPRAEEWPAVDVALLQSMFACGYIAYSDGQFQAARECWTSAIQTGQRLVKLKDFSKHHEIEGSKVAMRAAMACSIGLSHVVPQLEPRTKYSFNVSHLKLVPSALHPILTPLDQYPGAPKA